MLFVKYYRRERFFVSIPPQNHQKTPPSRKGRGFVEVMGVESIFLTSPLHNT